MPKDNSIKSVLVIGSGPIVIGQACEFDYSGTQACRVLRSEGIRVILINSNPATNSTARVENRGGCAISRPSADSNRPKCRTTPKTKCWQRARSAPTRPAGSVSNSASRRSRRSNQRAIRLTAASQPPGRPAPPAACTE